jgi:hypothetical protein
VFVRKCHVFAWNDMCLFEDDMCRLLGKDMCLFEYDMCSVEDDVCVIFIGFQIIILRVI